MKRELGIARCGLACCLCAENAECGGCHSESCRDRAWCEVRRCCIGKGLTQCSDCTEAETCSRGMQAKIKPHAFTLFARRFGTEMLLDCLAQNEASGIVYHRHGIIGDYDDFEDVETLISFIKKGKRTK